MPVTSTQERRKLELEKREIFARLEKVVLLGLSAKMPHAELMKRLEQERERVEAQGRDIERLREIHELLWGRRSAQNTGTHDA